MEKSLTIGVTTRRGDEAWIQANTRLYLDLLGEFGVQAVALSPDTPVTLPDGTHYAPDETGRLPDDILDRLDGLVLAGGGDVHPRYFGASLNGANPAAIDLKRDELELGLARIALARDLPTFGICRGCQVMNVAAGGGMVQDFPGHRSPEGQAVLHDVVLTPDSRLASLLAEVAGSTNTVAVNTYHHQGMDRASMAPSFTPVAMARPDDWLVEAFESPAHRWVIGVQWHPERLFELPAAHRRLWESFISACATTRKMESEDRARRA